MVLGTPGYLSGRCVSGLADAANGASAAGVPDLCTGAGSIIRPRAGIWFMISFSSVCTLCVHVSSGCVLPWDNYSVERPLL